MKRFAMTVAALVTMLMTATAQNLKWGKPSDEEWALTYCPIAPEADAVVLCKTVNIEYELSGGFATYTGDNQMLSMENYHLVGFNKTVAEENTSMTYDVKLRIKILKDSGADYGNIDIVYYNDENELSMYDDIESMSVVTFSRDGNKTKKQKLDKQHITDTRLDAHYMARHIQVPDLKAGDIVECQYKLFSRRATFLYDWQMQEYEIPVLFTRCHMEIPCFLTFNTQTPLHANVTSRVEEGVITLPRQTGDMGAPKRCKSNCYTIEGHDILPQLIEVTEEGTSTAPVKAEGKLIQLRSIEKNPQMEHPQPLPKGYRHIMIGEK